MLRESLDLAIETMQKQISKKPIIKPWTYAKCPTCNENLSKDLGDGYYQHNNFLERCPNVNCNQKLKWN